MIGTTMIIRKTALTAHLKYRIFFLLLPFFLINPFTDYVVNHGNAILGFLEVSSINKGGGILSQICFSMCLADFLIISPLRLSANHYREFWAALAPFVSFNECFPMFAVTSIS